jgi:hypothetical protein
LEVLVCAVEKKTADKKAIQLKIVLETAFKERFVDIAGNRIFYGVQYKVIKMKKIGRNQKAACERQPFDILNSIITVA